MASVTVSSGVTSSAVLTGGTASATHVAGDGVLTLRGGKSVNAIVSKGGIEVVAIGSATGTSVLAGGELVYAGGTIAGDKLTSGATEAVAKGAKVSGLKVGAGVTLVVSSGGIASVTTLTGGTETVLNGGKIVGAVTMTGTKDRLSVAGKTGVAFIVSGFAKTDTLDLPSFKFSTAEKLVFVENKAKTAGTLTITDGALKATVTLFGQYVATGFHLASDGVAGTTVTYAQPAVAHHLIAAPTG
jgi:autotransporter passenger strand-loop-strand repeat protein